MNNVCKECLVCLCLLAFVFTKIPNIEAKTEQKFFTVQGVSRSEADIYCACNYKAWEISFVPFILFVIMYHL